LPSTQQREQQQQQQNHQNLQAALQLPTNPNESPALEVCVLLAMLVVLRLLVYVTLRVKTKSV
jgi:hypothetical protein